MPTPPPKKKKYCNSNVGMGGVEVLDFPPPTLVPLDASRGVAASYL